MHISFDTLDAVRNFEKQGFPRNQAEQIVDTIKDTQSELMTRKDGEILKKDILIGTGIMIATAVGILATMIKFF